MVFSPFQKIFWINFTAIIFRWQSSAETDLNLNQNMGFFLTEFISLNEKVLPVIESYSYILCSNH